MNNISFIILNMWNRNPRETFMRMFDSVMKATILGDEIIIVDDSGVDSEDKLKYYEVSARHAYIIYNKKNSGMLASRYNGFKEAKNNFILNLDSDDYLINQGEFIQMRNKIIDPNRIYIYYQQDNYFSCKGSAKNDYKYELAVTSGLFKCTVWDKVIHRDILDKAYKVIDGYFNGMPYFNVDEDYVLAIAMLPYYDSIVELTSIPLINYTGAHESAACDCDITKYSLLMRMKSLCNKFCEDNLMDPILVDLMHFRQDRLFNYFKLKE